MADNSPNQNIFQSNPMNAPQNDLYDNLQIVKKDGFYITTNIWGDEAQDAANYGIIFTARWPIEILRIVERHETAGTAGGAVTLDVLRVPNGTAIASGDSMVVTKFNLKATANTLQTREGVTLNDFRQLRENQSIGLKTSGTLTDLAGVSITIYFQNYGRGNYR